MRGLRTRNTSVAALFVIAGLAAVTQAAATARVSAGAARTTQAPLAHAGRWITDSTGRVVILHGINMVYKRPPYYPGAVGFGADDSRLLSRIGFDAVRVGVIWKALEPAPGMFDEAYLKHIASTVRTLARHRIYSLLDFHQDLLNERFQGEGFPSWAIQDGGLPNPMLGFPGNYLGNPALQHALDRFWSNAPGPGGVGLEDRYAAAWRHVAARFASDPSVVGYELLNEPFPGTHYLSCAAPGGCPTFDSELTAFDRKVARAIRRTDRRHLIFYEPNVLFDFGAATDAGALHDRAAGFAFHDYCFRTTPTGCPSEPRGFVNATQHVGRTHEALLLTEFGSTPFAGDLTGMVQLADRNMVGWLEWSYCPCHDPTGATPDPIVLDPAKPPRGANLGSLALGRLVEPYPKLIAGTPQSWSFDRAARAFRLQYATARADHRGFFGAGSITEVAAPPMIYGGRYAVTVVGGTVASPHGAPVLMISACRGARSVSVTVRPRGRNHVTCTT